MADIERETSSTCCRCVRSSKRRDNNLNDDDDGAKGRPKITLKALWEEPRYFRWITTFVWAVSGMFHFGVIGDFSMFFIYMEKDMKASVMELNWMGTLPWILFAVCSPLTNVLVKRFGYRLTIAGSCAACAVGLFVTSFPRQLWPMYVTYGVVFGGGSIVIYTAGCIYITGYFDEKSGKGPVSSMGFTFELAVLIFSPVIQVTADAWGWRWSVRLLSLGTLLSAGALAFCIRQPPLDLSRRIVRSPPPDQYEPISTIIDTNPSAIGIEKVIESGGEKTMTTTSTSRGRYLKMLSMPCFWIWQLATVVSFTALSFSHINLGSYLTSIDISTEVTARLHSFLAGGALFGRLIVMLFVHKLPVTIPSLYPVLCLFNCFFTILILVTAHGVVLYIFSTATGLLRALYFSLSTGLCVELFGIEYAAEAYIALFCAWGVGSVLAAIIPGVTHQLTGSYTISVMTSAAFWGVSAVFFFIVFVLFRRWQRRRTPLPPAITDEDKKMPTNSASDCTKKRSDLFDAEEEGAVKEELLIAEIMTTI